MAVITEFPSKRLVYGRPEWIQRFSQLAPSNVVENLKRRGELVSRKQTFRERVRKILGEEHHRVYDVYKMPEHLSSGGV